MSIETTAFNVIMNIQAIVPMTAIGTLAIFGLMKLLAKRILKQYEREDSCNLWMDIVCPEYKSLEHTPIPSTNHSGDITK